MLFVFTSRRIAAAALLLAASTCLAEAPAALQQGTLYGVTVSVDDPARLGAARVLAEVLDAAGPVTRKHLHAGDPDFYFTFRARQDGSATVQLTPQMPGIRTRFTALRDGMLLSEQAPSWREAQPIELGETVTAGNDERPYLPASSQEALSALQSGQHWYRITGRGPGTRLAFFNVEVTDRDVPPDVDVFREDGNGGLLPEREGTHNYRPEATQNFPGLASYRTRRIQPGVTYYLRVSGNHPAYRLHTLSFEPAPYRNPRQAVRTGMEFLIQLGDSWHANMPRRGAVASRDTMPHAEAQGCVACHATQFPLRGYLTAMRNGYRAQSPYALDYLLEQIRNNPRPLYGQTDTAWSRVIFSARAVSSRIPALLELAREVGVAPAADDAMRGLARYLALSLSDRKELAGDEADGASPAVSPLEIAVEAWRSFRALESRHPSEAEWAERRKDLERMATAYKPANVIDLNWKIVAMSAMGRRSAVEPLLAELSRWRRPDGRFPYQFNQQSDPADFITYHALYAMALAGLKPEDPRVAPVLAYTMAAQLPSGGWQGAPAHKSFNTPFRETQFAVMALSTLFPEDAGPALPAEATEDALRQALRSDSVLTREAAARRLAVLGTKGSAVALGAALGDESKLVQRAAAYALRRMAERDRAAVVPVVQAALESDSARVRWGGLRVFSQQFQALSASDALLHGVLSALGDPSSANRALAIQAASRWYTWQSDRPEIRTAILEALCARAGVEKESVSARLIRESLYNILDENTGYLEAWANGIANPAAKQQVIDARRAVAREQAAILARHLQPGGTEKNLALLTALWDVPVRHMAIPENNQAKVDVILPAFHENLSAGATELGSPGYVYPPYREALAFQYGTANRFQRVRVGNDSELIDFSGAGPELEIALTRLIERGTADERLAAIKATSVLGEAATSRLTIAIFRVLVSGTAAEREAARAVYAENALGRLTLSESTMMPSEDLVEALASAMHPGASDALAVALPLLASEVPGAPITRALPVNSAMEVLLRTPPRGALGLVVKAAGVFPRVADGPLMRAVMLEALQSRDRAEWEPAISVVVKNYLAEITMPDLAEQFLAATRGQARRLLLDSLDPTRYALRLDAVSSYNPGRVVIPKDADLFSSNIVREFVARCFDDPDEDVRAATLDLAMQFPQLRRAPEVAARLAKPVTPVRARSQVVAAMLRGRTQPLPAPDFEFFARRVEPILQRTGADGKACAMCHASHAIFPLRAAVTSTRDNYNAALRVVDLERPRNSLLLIKPTRANDATADTALYRSTHNGGERWPGGEASPEYETVLRWIRGARID